ncbi:MAG: GGDEF domain-containing protein, partial [Spirochaetales bacterium]
ERTAVLEASNAHLERANLELKTANDRYQDLALKDPLTGLANRRAFQESGLKELNRSRRYGRELSLVLFDMDDLKRLNDEYGHPVGDEAIRRVGRVLAAASRAADLAARLGGDEFALILPETDLQEALALAQRCIEVLAAENLVPESDKPVCIGVSVGATRCADADISFEEVYARADRALYRAKNSGKGRAVVEQPH